MPVRAADLLAAAASGTGLEDFGAPSFREGLDRLVDALDAEAALSELGVLAVEAQIVGNLSNRLRVVDWVGRHPELAAERIKRPLVVLGLPRTGTTLVHELFHRDPANRSLMRWEAADSVPPPEAATFTTDPRVAAAREAAAAMDALNPEMKSLHYEAPDGPTECVAVLAQEFQSLLWSVVADVPSYTRWLVEHGAATAYGYHHQVLSLLQSRAPGRWALKTPQHALCFDELLACYPDARLVMTHREPMSVVTSLCSLARCLGGTFSDADHTASVARTWTDIAATITDRMVAARDRLEDTQIVDVAYDDLVRDPLKTVEAILGHFGEPLSGAARAGMERYLATDPHRAFPPHRYTPEDVGLDAAEVRERFGAYAERFGVTVDA